MIEFKSFNQLISQIEEVDDHIKKAQEVFDGPKMEQMMEKATHMYTDAVIKNAPKDTNQMSDHIKDRKSNTSTHLAFEVYGEKQAFYWRFQEYGAYNVWARRYLPGKHFVEKSINETDPQVKRFFETEISKFINK